MLQYTATRTKIPRFRLTLYYIASYYVFYYTHWIELNKKARLLLSDIYLAQNDNKHTQATQTAATPLLKICL